MYKGGVSRGQGLSDLQVDNGPENIGMTWRLLESLLIWSRHIAVKMSD